MAQRLDERAVLRLLAAAMEQQTEGSWIFRPTLLDAQKNVSGHHDGRVGDEGIEVPALAAFLQFQMLLGRTEEYFDVPTLAVNADNVFIGNGEVSGKQGQPVFLVLVSHEDEFGLEAILELNLGVGQDLGSASAFSDQAVNLRHVHLLPFEDVVDFGCAFDHADDGDVLANLGDQGRHGEPTVHEQELGLDAGFQSAFDHGFDQFRGFGHSLLPLPCAPYVFAEWKQATVNIDYHVEVDGHYYSVPCSLIKKRVDVRITVTSVECFHKGQRVSVHPRSMQKGRHTTVMEHMPKSHQEYAGWTPERIMEWARKLGPNVSALTEAIMDSRKHPVQGYRSGLGVIGLAKEHGTERLDAACERALHMGALSHKSLKSILKSGLDRLPLPIHNVDQTSVPHDNVRGPEYYRKEASC